jgi:hypothetical protein
MDRGPHPSQDRPQQAGHADRDPALTQTKGNAMATVYQFPTIPKTKTAPHPDVADLIAELCGKKWDEMSEAQQDKWWELVRP